MSRNLVWLLMVVTSTLFAGQSKTENIEITVKNKPAVVTREDTLRIDVERKDKEPIATNYELKVKLLDEEDPPNSTEIGTGTSKKFSLSVPVDSLLLTLKPQRWFFTASDNDVPQHKEEEGFVRVTFLDIEPRITKAIAYLNIESEVVLQVTIEVNASPSEINAPYQAACELEMKFEGEKNILQRATYKAEGGRNVPDTIILTEVFKAGKKGVKLNEVVGKKIIVNGEAKLKGVTAKGDDFRTIIEAFPEDNP